MCLAVEGEFEIPEGVFDQVRFSKRDRGKLQRIALPSPVGRPQAGGVCSFGPIAVLLRLGAGKTLLQGVDHARTLSSDSFRRSRCSCVISCLVVSLAMISTFAFSRLVRGIALSVVPVEVAV